MIKNWWKKNLYRDAGEVLHHGENSRASELTRSQPILNIA